MSLKELGDWAYIFMASGLMMMSGSFILTTKWWATNVGRSIAAFFGSVGLIMLWGILRQLEVIPDNEVATLWARLALFGLLGLAVWSMFLGFIWAQYLSPRRRRNAASRKSRAEVPSG